MTKTNRRALLGGLAAGLMALTALSGAAYAQSVTLSYLIPSGADGVAVAEELVKAFEAKNPDIKIEIETRPGGSEGDNLVKTRLATGSMADIFRYNSGSLFQAINPAQFLVDLSNEPWEADIQPSFKQVVTAPDGTIRGAPMGAAMGGGIYYNKKIYEELGLSVPKTWDEFMANNEKIKAAGKVPVIQTYGDTWTSQLFVLADYYNVAAKDQSFANRYTAGEAKFATDPNALRGFEKLQAAHDAGFFNEDFGAAKYDDGIRMVANGDGAHYPMLTFATTAIAQTVPDKLADVGFFAQPGDDASLNGLTVWMPDGIYIPQTTANLDAAKKFVAFVASVEGCEAQTRAGGASGPYLVNGCTLPADIPPAVSDMLPYFAEGGQNGPALEFLSPIKGPALEQITVEVGSGIRPAADGAALYDEDVRKQAQQLGLPGW
ncbi:extracellular solute-binding protein [Devosia sp. 63-57]|uniref:ABC transporter substrate-binding protein n=1 Tax=Devosia sp. 63-57 TaxID=1895751 RepID=UPI0008686F8C|nr:extracellular solute-binding protein [Devosia sp. 63-57]ODT48008.1 MAG: ABC transporter substrate-binding protein [Pelagibacterium sp. SCN 63-126]ODU82581.1 MAG: ABC transporter substrate-binding protein [Pelagibacterium sp. SCN 63-17]OJX42284.1 MAG: ABC transporter substrate-binding protein [Devosia sp. 63-57]